LELGNKDKVNVVKQGNLCYVDLSPCLDRDTTYMKVRLSKDPCAYLLLILQALTAES